jgi:hypothetical protein
MASPLGMPRWILKPLNCKRSLANFSSSSVGPIYQTLGLGYLAFQLVEGASGARQGSGFDIAIVRDGVIAELYTVLTEPP